MSNKMLVVYNTCGIGENPNVDGWIGKLEPLIGDEFEGLRVCHSDCGSDDKSLEKVRERFGGLISHYYVRDHLPVHITFNSCVRNCVKRYGEFEYYVHLSSGTTIDLESLKRIYKWLITDKEVARVVVPAQNDNSSPTDFTKHALLLKREGNVKSKSHRIEQLKKDQIWDTSKKYVLKPGQRSTNHASIISNEWFKKYNNKLHPDIYNGIGVEGTYSFLATSIHRQNVIVPTELIDEYVPNEEVEGTSDRHNIKQKRVNWMFGKIRDLEKINLRSQHLGFVTDLPMKYRLEPKVMYNGYNISDYDPDVPKIYEGLFNEDGYYIDKSNEKFLYDNLYKDLFLCDDEFDYNNIDDEMWE